MKSKLGILGAVTLVACTSSSLAGCSNTKQLDQNKDLDNIVEVVDLGFIDYDIDSHNEAQLERTVLAAVNKKNLGLNITMNDVDFNLVYQNKTGDF